MRLLLDVNVLVALLDEGHIHHQIAQKLIARPKLEIASCALTENGVLRVMNLPAYSVYGPVGFDAVRHQLKRLSDDLDHEFWNCDVSLVGSNDSKQLANQSQEPGVAWGRVMGHNQITDVYLLALAVKHGGALATFDHRVAISTVHGAKPKHLVVL